MGEEILSCGALFAGIGGFCFGFEDAGFTTIWANEIDAASSEVYKKNFPHVEHLSFDIKTLSVNDIGLSPVDVLHAGFPCQSFSIAGNKLGFEDERGQLFFEIIRIIGEFGSRKPKIVVLENTPNLLIGDNGNWMDEVIYQLQFAGYWVTSAHCHILDTYEHGGLPQNRKRLFVIATSQEHFMENPFTGIGKISKRTEIEDLIDLTEKKESYCYLPKTNRYGEMILSNLSKRGPYSIAQLRKYEVRSIAKGRCPTLTANMGLGGHNVPFIKDDFGVRKLTIDECLGLQGFPSSFGWPADISNGKCYRMVGNSVSPRISKLIADAIYFKLKGE